MTRAGLVLVLAGTMLLGGGVAWAVWGATGAASPPTVSAGTLDLTAGPATGQEFLVGPGGTWPSWSLALAGAFPGESVAASFVVHNNGTADLAFSATVTADGATLGGSLLVSANAGGSAQNTGAVPPRTGTCAGGVSLTPAPVAANGAVVASSVALASGQSVTLCVVVRLSPTAPASLQGQATAVTIALSAAQDGAR